MMSVPSSFSLSAYVQNLCRSQPYPVRPERSVSEVEACPERSRRGQTARSAQILDMSLSFLYGQYSFQGVQCPVRCCARSLLVTFDCPIDRLLGVFLFLNNLDGGDHNPTPLWICVAVGLLVSGGIQPFALDGRVEDPKRNLDVFLLSLP